jgi:hypothetical protein
MVLAVVIVSPLVFGIIALRWGSEAWLKDFAELARSLGRPL